MSKKEYVSPQFKWLSVTFIDDVLSISMPDINDDEFEGNDDLFGDEFSVDGEGLVNENNNVVNSWDGW